MLSDSRKQEIEDCDRVIADIVGALEGGLDESVEDAAVSVALQPGDFSHDGFVGTQVTLDPDGDMWDIKVVGTDKGQPYTIEYTELDTLGVDALNTLLGAVQRRLAEVTGGK